MRGLKISKADSQKWLSHIAPWTVDSLGNGHTPVTYPEEFPKGLRRKRRSAG